ncbi:MAG: GTP-binding protein [Blastopirellula sp.]|nr:MAG: GTP-binding protein [Blastopirellula sp.]
MGNPSHPKLALLIVASFSKYPIALEFGCQAMQDLYGPLALKSESFDHSETSYYAAEMGTELRKEFWAFETLIDPALLSDVKLASNAIENQLSSTGEYSETRPLNLDSGYITQSKLVLATTKDRNHRIYLKDGIYAEITLQWQSKQWKAWPWTYPDYQREDFHQFFTECRNYLRQQYRTLES